MDAVQTVSGLIAANRGHIGRDLLGAKAGAGGACHRPPRQVQSRQVKERGINQKRPCGRLVPTGVEQTKGSPNRMVTGPKV